MFGCQIAFPYSQDSPAGGAQCARGQSVSVFVSAKFFGPPFGTGLWRGRMFRLWASVPKTTVHKDDDTLLAEDEIGFAK